MDAYSEGSPPDQAKNPIQKKENPPDEVSGIKLIELKKTWRDYLFEFSVPFLAVTAAFLLSNEKDAYYERKLEKQLIQSIVYDLESDIHLIDEQISFHMIKIGEMDTLLQLLKEPESAENISRMHHLGRMTSRSIQFNNNDKTIEQMKNAATFRVIQNQEAVSEIIDYYQKIKVIRLVEEREKDELENYKRIAVKIFDPFSHRNVVSGNTIKEVRTNPEFISGDTLDKQELAGYIQYLNTSRGRLISLKTDLKKSAEKLIQDLQKTYALPVNAGKEEN
jgi:hypothetical protein